MKKACQPALIVAAVGPPAECGTVAGQPPRRAMSATDARRFASKLRALIGQSLAPGLQRPPSDGYCTPP